MRQQSQLAYAVLSLLLLPWRNTTQQEHGQLVCPQDWVQLQQGNLSVQLEPLHFLQQEEQGQMFKRSEVTRTCVRASPPAASCKCNDTSQFETCYFNL
jgi:hypothetical protein